MRAELIVAVGVALEVVLVFGHGLPEGTGLADLGYDLAGPVARGVNVADRLLGHLALLLTRIEDLRAVARAHETFAKVSPVELEEQLQQVPIGDPVWIEGHLDRLGVPAIVVLGWVVVLAAGPSHAGGDDSVAVAQQLLHDPETASREDRGLGVVAHRFALPPNCAEDDCRRPAGLAEPPHHHAQRQAARLGHPARPVQSAAASQMGGVTPRGAMFRSEDRKLGRAPISSSAPSRPPRPPPI